MKKYDAIVIGAGHNGLTNAAYLAKAGLDVLMVEKNTYVGGATASRELHKNWIYSNASYVSSLLRPEVFRSLELAKYGLQIVPYAGGNVTMSEDGDYIGSYVDPDVSRRDMARISPRDANAKVRFDRDLMRQCRFIRQFLLRTAPDPTSFKPRDLMGMLQMGKALMDLGEDVF
jgi:phytoene dehydrogenase-like protein